MAIVSIYAWFAGFYCPKIPTTPLLCKKAGWKFLFSYCKFRGPYQRICTRSVCNGSQLKQEDGFGRRFQNKTRWWFNIFFYVHPYLGKWSRKQVSHFKCDTCSCWALDDFFTRTCCGTFWWHFSRRCFWLGFLYVLFPLNFLVYGLNVSW